ncbi:MAG TPA: hypothetical protein VIH90_05925 [Candidatus Saccharimonadales bacterium]
MTTETVFNNITAPLQTILKKEADQLHGDSLLYKLSLYFLTMNLVYAIIKKIPSIALLVTGIKTSPDALELELVQASASMCQSALKSIHLTASNNVQQESKVMPFLAPFYAA